MRASCLPLTLMALLLLAGCAEPVVAPGRRAELTPDLAAARVEKTTAFRAAVAAADAPTRTVIDATPAGYVAATLFAAGRARPRRLASFRAFPDGRVYAWDAVREEWRIEAVFD